MNMPTPSDFVLTPELGKPVIETWLTRISESLFDKKGLQLDNLSFGKGLAFVIKYDANQTPLNGEVMAEISARMRDYGWHINFSNSGGESVTVALYPLV